MKKLVMAIAFMVFGATVSFAQTAPTAKTNKAKTTQKAKTAAAKTMYECPMHCEPAKDHAGTCGKCNMDLVAVKPKAKAKKQ